MESIYSRFRQEEEVVARRQKKYLKYFQQGGLILDVGCGRGEFLKLLKQNHMEAEGVDSDPGMVDVCLKKNLKAVHSPAMDYLSTKREVYDGIFASHVLEHMSGDSVIEFLKSCHRALKPRGKLIIITPNSENLQVMTCTFWLDLTHQRPYPLMLVKALLEENGFKILDSGEDRDTKSTGIKRKAAGLWVRCVLGAELAQAFYGAQDIFVVGEK